MKRFIYKFAALPLIALLVISSIGCGAENIGDISDANEKQANKDTLYILCAGFSEYDWTQNILGENPAGVRLELLNMSGADMHSYQPSVSDMVKIADCDLLIYTGGLSEFWIEKATSSSGSSNNNTNDTPQTGKQILSLMEYFEENSDLFPAYVQDAHEHTHEGHEHDADDSSRHKHSDDEDEHEGHNHESDEHIWLSLKTARVFCEKIADVISELDPENREYYKENLKAYISELSSLDTEYSNTVSSAKNDVMIIADRFPFTYMMQDYGIHCHAAFYGCSAETEASFETVIDLAEDLNSDDLNHIVILKNSSSGEKLANTIIAASERKNVKICTLDSLQAVNADELASGYSYINAMKNNMEVLSECLN